MNSNAARLVSIMVLRSKVQRQIKDARGNKRWLLKAWEAALQAWIEEFQLMLNISMEEVQQAGALASKQLSSYNVTRDEVDAMLHATGLDIAEAYHAGRILASRKLSG